MNCDLSTPSPSHERPCPPPTTPSHPLHPSHPTGHPGPARQRVAGGGLPDGLALGRLPAEPGAGGRAGWGWGRGGWWGAGGVKGANGGWECRCSRCGWWVWCVAQTPAAGRRVASCHGRVMRRFSVLTFFLWWPSTALANCQTTNCQPAFNCQPPVRSTWLFGGPSVSTTWEPKSCCWTGGGCTDCCRWEGSRVRGGGCEYQPKLNQTKLNQGELHARAQNHTGEGKGGFQPSGSGVFFTCAGDACNC